MKWDVIIIGAGPAAIQAAIMGASEGMKVLVLERDKVGGQIGQTPLLENFIAANGGVTGPSFADAMKAQAEKMGAIIRKGEVIGFKQYRDGSFAVNIVGGLEDAYALVIATGNRWQDLDIPGIRAGIQAKTVHYGPVECLRADTEGQDVAVYGGGPSAGQAIIALAQKAHKVNVLMRSTLRMPQYLVDKIMSLSNVKLYEYTTIDTVVADGPGKLDVMLSHGGGEQKTGHTGIHVSQLFMCSGLVPNSEWLPAEIEKDEHGRVLVGTAADASSFLGTSMEGVYAIGDVRHGSTARVSAAIGDGAFVVSELWKYFRRTGECSFCSSDTFARAPGDINPYKVDQTVLYQGGEFSVYEVLNAQQVKLNGVAGVIDVRHLSMAAAV